MQFHITKAASEQLHKQLENDHSGYLKLLYDIEGCGCSVSGVPALRLTQTKEPGDVEGVLTDESEPTPVPVLYEKRQEIFFEERLILDYNPQKNGYVLKSDQQIYHQQLKIQDKNT